MSARDELERLYGNKGKKKPNKGIASTVAGVASRAVSTAENIVAHTTGNSSKKTARQLLNEQYGSPDAPGAVRARSVREGREKFNRENDPLKNAARRVVGATERTPNDQWQEDWQEEFYARYNTDQDSAYSYAKEINDYLASQRLAADQERIKKTAARNPVASTIAGVVTSPLALLDAADKGLTYLATGELPQRDKVTLGDVSRVMTAGVSEGLNEKYGTLDEGIPIIGGKGWGDVYSLGNSALQSLVLGNTIGSGATLATFFGQGASSGMDEIKARGGSDEQAILYGLASGAAEVLMEKVPLDNLLKGGDAVRFTLKSWGKNVAKQAAMEGAEEAMTSVANALADQFIMGDKSNFYARAQEYVDQGMDEEAAKTKAWWDYAEDVIFDFAGGAASGGGSMVVQTGLPVALANRQAGRASTPESDAALIERALAADEGSKPNRLAQKYQGAGKLSGGQINDLEAAYSEYETEQRYNLAAEKARERLEQIDAEGSTVATAIAKTLTGKELNRRERRALERSAEGKKILQDMQFDRSWQREAAAAESRNKDGTAEDPFGEPEAIDQAEPSGISERLAADNASNATDNEAAVLDNTANAAETVAEPVAKPVEAAVENVENLTTETADSAPAVEENAENETLSRTVEEVAEGYGNQAGEVLRMYQDGQDVDAFEQGVRAAWELGNSGIPMERAVSSQRTQGITEHQRKQAYLLGQGAARLAAQGKATANAKAATSGTVRRKGVVKAQSGITIDELSKTFNDRQRSAYKLLSFYAEVTGIDVVLYKGTQEQESGRFAHGEDTIYIDITAGTNGWDATDLGAYTMMRTFAHEFVHFVEKWNPTAYNVLREAVFAEMEKNGSDPEALVELAMQEQGLDFDQASREVVAEALTDILPESQFAQTLAQKHKRLFEKLKERLEAFVSELKAHWKKLTGNNSREAVALKRQVGDALEYAEEIVQLLDRVAGEAVEAYQATVAAEETSDADDGYDAEKAALLSYKSGGSYLLNAKLREGWGLRKWEQDIADGLDRMLQKLPVHKGKVYRNIMFDGFGDQEARDAFMADYSPGAFVVYPAYTSTSTSPNGYHLDGRYVVHMEIESVNGRNVEGFGNNDESEILFPRESRFVIDRVAYDTDGTPTIYMTEVPYEGEGIQDASAGSSGREQRPPAQIRKGEVQRLPEQNRGNGEVYSVPGINSEGDLHESDGLPGVQEEVKLPETGDRAVTQFDESVVSVDDERFSVNTRKNGVLVVAFTKKAPDAVRQVLKDRGFKWKPKGKHWEGKGDKSEVADALRSAYGDALAEVEAEQEKPVAQQPDTKEVPKPVIEAAPEIEEEDVNHGEHEAEAGGVLDHRADGTGDSGVLGDREAGTGAADDGGRDSVGVPAERGREAVRHGSGADAQRSERGPDDGDPQSRVPELTDEAPAGELSEAVQELSERSAPREPDAGNGDQKQVRRIALTDRQVLELFADEALPKDASSAERDAFAIFRKRLERLQTLQQDRVELGRQYKEQQFGPDGDRAKAKETAGKMEALDKSILKAADEVLSAEEAPVMRRVIQSARDAARRSQAKHDQDLLKEYRAKRAESDGQRKYRRAVQREVKELQNFILHPDTKRMKLCPEFLQKPVLEFLSTIDQSSKRKLSGGGDTQADQRFANRLADLTEILEKAAGKDDDGNVDIFEGYLDLPGDFLERVKKFSSDARKLTEKVGDRNVVNEMTAAQLHELLEVLTGMKTLIRNANTFHSNAMFQHISQAGGETVAFTRKHRDWSKARGRLAALGNMESWVFWKNVRPALIFQRFGKAGLSILQELMDGQDKLARNTKAVVDFAEKTYTDKEVKAWEEQRKTIRFADGTHCRLTVAQIMGLYCMAKREQAIDHLTHGGFVIQDENGGIRKVHISVDDLGAFSAALNNRQRAVADKLQKFMSERGGEWGNHVTLHRFGIKVYGEEFYYPLATYDEKRSASIDKPEGSDLHALLNMSFTKQLTKGAKNAVMAYSIFDVFADHMGAMAQYNAMALPVLDAVKWLNWSQSTVNEQGFEDTVGVKTELRRVFGTPPVKRGKGGNVSINKGYAEHFILNLLKSYNSTSPQATPNDKLGLGMLHRYNRSQVGFNRSVVLKQPLAIFRAMQVLSPASIAKGANPATVAQGLREMLKYSGIAIWKDLGFYDVNVSKGMGKLIRRDSGILDKITDASMFKAEWADKITWAMIWNGCKAQCGGNMKKAAELFNKVIYESQVVDSVLTKTEYMRDQGFISRYLSSFMSEPVTAVSPLLNDVFLMEMEMQRKGGSFQTAWQKYGRRFVRSTAVYSVTGIITAVASALIAAWRDDDDYQDFDEKFREAMDGAIGEELNPFTKLPLVSNVAKGLDAAYQAMAKGEEPWLALASGLPMTEIIEYTVDGGKILHDLISGEDTNYTWYGAVRKLLQAFSGATGTPAATLSREVVDTWNNIVGRMAPSLKVKTYERSEAEELRDAFLAGYLTEEEASDRIRELVAEANGDKDKLKELGFSSIKDEDDIYWKLRSWEGGSDWSKYDALAQAMANGEDISGAMDELTTHGVKEKTVRSQIRSIVGQWLEQGAITPEEAEGLLVRYGGRDSEEAEAAVQEWRAELETGTAYDDIAEAVLDGELTEKQAAQMYVTYGGYEAEEAREKAHRLAFIRDNPGCPDISAAAVADYEEHCKGAGIAAKDFYNAWGFYKDARADVDENGKSISGSKRRKVLEYIDSMKLTSKQKDALYFAFGYAESKLWDTPWH